MKIYECGDWVSCSEAGKLLKRKVSVDEAMKLRKNIMAVYIGEKRCPKKNEWYLSGAIVEAYRAPNDLSTEYMIAKLVLTETKTVRTIKIIS